MSQGATEKGIWASSWGRIHREKLFCWFSACYTYDLFFLGSSSFLEYGTEAVWGNWFSVWQHCEKQPIIQYKYGLWRDSVARKGKQRNTFVYLFEIHKALCQSTVDFWNINSSIHIWLSIYFQVSHLHKSAEKCHDGYRSFTAWIWDELDFKASLERFQLQ